MRITLPVMPEGDPRLAWEAGFREGDFIYKPRERRVYRIKQIGPYVAVITPFERWQLAPWVRFKAFISRHLL